jgi:hypothetical protein
MRPKTRSRTPQTMIDVVEDPVDGMVPDEPDELPPLDVEAPDELPPLDVTGAITKVAVRVPLLGPVAVTV